jgi:hypothetical protein
LVQAYHENPAQFSIQYVRKGQTRSIDPKIEQNILKELSIDKKIIEDPKTPTHRYNYSYIKSSGLLTREKDFVENA